MRRTDVPLWPTWAREAPPGRLGERSGASRERFGSVRERSSSVKTTLLAMEKWAQAKNMVCLSNLSSKNENNIRKRHTCKRSWPYGAYLSASLANMGLEGAAGASWSASRSVPGALRERPGALQQRQNNPTRYGEMDASKKYGLFVKSIFKKQKYFGKRRTCERSWPYVAYLSASLVNMGLEGAAGAARRASRSAPGAPRRH